MSQALQEKGFIAAFKNTLCNNYFNTKGRASRSEVWKFSIMLSVMEMIISVIILTTSTEFINNVFSAIWLVAFIAPTITMNIRRLHDTNHSGWYLLLFLIPIVCVYPLYLVYFKNSDKRNNQYGVYPPRYY